MALQTTIRRRAGEKSAAGLIEAVADLKRLLAVYARDNAGRFILFGSAARREMRPDSDVDIMLDFPVERENEALAFAEKACQRLGLKCDVLSLRWTSDRLRARLDKEGLFLPGDEDQWASAMSMDDRLGDILDAAHAATSHFRAAGQLFELGGFDQAGIEGYGRGMAVLQAMLQGHRALEDALVRIMKASGEAPPSGSDWHRQVIERAAEPSENRPAILSRRLAEAASETRSFRHFAAHAYTVTFDPEKARVAVDAAQVLADGLEKAIASFVKTMHLG